METIQIQDSACPYHDWNHLITAECYAANAASRILDGDGQISEILNNYSKISFNFGPTLLHWMAENAPEVYNAVLAADQESQRTFSGHGSAIAQPYNHMIMPLANSRDKYTQIVWGIRDFEHRFKRAPEGMWLPETSVDLETLDILADCGIRFTILAPHQASRVRQLGARAWRDVSGGRIDPTTAYELRLRSGRTISLFFYDAPISRAVAFEDLLISGEQFANRLLDGFSESRMWPQIVNIATDGETYGHHRRHGDMALAYALQYIESHSLACLTNYGEYLEANPPAYQVELFCPSSWSCAHGLERWRSDCGCNTGMHPEWNQSWRTPLRKAVDGVRDTLEHQIETLASRIFRDPWAARNDYIQVLLDRSSDSVQRFISSNALRELNTEEKVIALKLMELQRHAMLMYTSCGWFFDDISGIESVQVLQYAGRVLQLARDLFGDSLESGFLDRLELAKGNIPEYQNGRIVYEKLVMPAMIDLRQVGAHYAVSSMFDIYDETARVYCYQVKRDDYNLLQAGDSRVAVGQLSITSEITGECGELTFGVLHFGDTNVNAGVRECGSYDSYQTLLHDVTGAFTDVDLAGVLRLLDKGFGPATYSLKSLFRDEQRKILDMIMSSTLVEVEGVYRQIYEHHAPLMHFLTDLGAPFPRALHTAAELVLNVDLRRALEEEDLNLKNIASILEEAQRWRIALDSGALERELKQIIETDMERLRADPAALHLLHELDAMVSIVKSLPIKVNLWKAQNIFYEMAWTAYTGFRDKANQGSTTALDWINNFGSLGGKLGVRIPSADAERRKTRPGCDSRVIAEPVLETTRISSSNRE